MKKIAALIAFLLICVALRGAVADTAAVPDYLIGADDILEISVANFPDLAKTLTVLPDGKISFSEIGDIQAAGKSPKELATTIQTELEKTRNRANVVVSVKEVHSKHVRIVGAVKTSNAFDFKRGWRLMDLVATAGGLSVKPIRVSGRIVKANGKLITLNIPDAVSKPDTDANPLLDPDDLVILDELDVQRQISVMGQVAKPGTFDLTETTSVLSVIAEAGSPTESAALSNAYVLRGPTKIPLNLVSSLLRNRDDPTVTGFKLHPGDVLFIPETIAKVAVLGQVSKPGYFPVSEKEEMTVLKALSLAGGPTQEGDLRKASILRIIDGKPVSKEINIEAMIKHGNFSKNVVMKADEMLVIPTKNHKAISGSDFISPFITFLTFGILR